MRFYFLGFYPVDRDIFRNLLSDFWLRDQGKKMIKGGWNAYWQGRQGFDQRIYYLNYSLDHYISRDKGDIMKTCKCGTMIDFVTMESEKKMPVEIQKPVLVLVKAFPEAINSKYKIVAGLLPHWINCPYSKQFKKEKKKNGH